MMIQNLILYCIQKKILKIFLLLFISKITICQLINLNINNKIYLLVSKYLMQFFSDHQKLIILILNYKIFENLVFSKKIFILKFTIFSYFG